jgi:hypothetical protein
MCCRNRVIRADLDRGRQRLCPAALRFYLDRLESKLRNAGVTAPLLIGNSNGGLSASATAQSKPVFFISSGRSSGAVGAERLAAVLGEPNLVAFDMGGTTASAALVHRGVLSRTHEYEFRAGMSVPSRFIKAGGYMMRVPTVDVAEVGNGAGSIATIDVAGLLTVGPLSAGAAPGPVCYGRGGSRPTVTDANVVLGYINPAHLVGGALRLNAAKALDRTPTLGHRSPLDRGCGLRHPRDRQRQHGARHPRRHCQRGSIRANRRRSPSVARGRCACDRHGRSVLRAWSFRRRRCVHGQACLSAV